jgi:hypothetical protein
MLSLEEYIAYCGLAAIQGLLVLLPRGSGPAGWSRLRSPLWALVLPASLVAGTFGVLDVHHGAIDLAVLAAVATPVFVVLAVTGVVRGPRWPWLVALPLLGASVALDWPAQLGATLLTALGCLTVGAAFVRLTPLPWLAAGIAAMCVVDVVLLASGLGAPAAHQLEIALKHSPLPEFHRAQIGSMNRDYPDLVLAAVLGATLAGKAQQLTAAVLVTVLAAANGLLFAFADILPGTLPLGVAATIVFMLDRRRRTALRRTSRPQPALDLRSSRAQPGAPQPMEA